MVYQERGVVPLSEVPLISHVCGIAKERVCLLATTPPAISEIVFNFREHLFSLFVPTLADGRIVSGATIGRG